MWRGPARGWLPLTALFAAAFVAAMVWRTRPVSMEAASVSVLAARVAAPAPVGPVASPQPPRNMDAVQVKPPPTSRSQQQGWHALPAAISMELQNQALSAEESEDRAAALSQLAGQPASAALPLAEQVLRTDTDLRNRMAAIRLIASAPDRDAQAPAVRRLLQDYVSDPQAPVAELAQEAYATLPAGAAPPGG